MFSAEDTWGRRRRFHVKSKVRVWTKLSTKRHLTTWLDKISSLKLLQFPTNWPWRRGNLSKPQYCLCDIRVYIMPLSAARGAWHNCRRDARRKCDFILWSLSSQLCVSLSGVNKSINKSMRACDSVTAQRFKWQNGTRPTFCWVYFTCTFWGAKVHRKC